MLDTIIRYVANCLSIILGWLIGDYIWYKTHRNSIGKYWLHIWS